MLRALKDAAVGRHREEMAPSSAFGTGPGGELDAETRRNAIRALVGLCEEVGVGDDGTDTDDDVRHHQGRDDRVEGSSTSSNAEVTADPAASTSVVSSTRGDCLKTDQEAGEVVAARGTGSTETFRETGDVTEHHRPQARRWRPLGLTPENVEGVMSTLLTVTGDYSVDKRGDVGSWCRMEALDGLERLTRLAVRASRGLPLENRGEHLISKCDA